MIQISELTEKDKGRNVEYNPGYKTEQGIISSWNEVFIFVRYVTTAGIVNPTAAATDPKDLSFM